MTRSSARADADGAVDQLILPTCRPAAAPSVLFALATPATTAVPASGAVVAGPRLGAPPAASHRTAAASASGAAGSAPSLRSLITKSCLLLLTPASRRSLEACFVPCTTCGVPCAVTDDIPGHRNVPCASAPCMRAHAFGAQHTWCVRASVGQPGAGQADGTRLDATVQTCGGAGLRRACGDGEGGGGCAGRRCDLTRQRRPRVRLWRQRPPALLRCCSSRVRVAQLSEWLQHASNDLGVHRTQLCILTASCARGKSGASTSTFAADGGIVAIAAAATIAATVAITPRGARC